MKITSLIKIHGLQFFSDFRNLVRFGVHFPRYAERLSFEPDKNMPVMGGGARYGDIISDWPHAYNEFVCEISPVKEVLAHFVQGRSWNETGLYERMERKLFQRGYVDGCRCMADVYKRYENLDRLYDETAKTGRLKTQCEIDPHNIREFGGITLHIDADSRLVFSRIGQHRMAIVLALGLSEAPFALGAVDAVVARSFLKARQRYRAPNVHHV